MVVHRFREEAAHMHRKVACQLGCSAMQTLAQKLWKQRKRRAGRHIPDSSSCNSSTCLLVNSGSRCIVSRNFVSVPRQTMHRRCLPCVFCSSGRQLRFSGAVQPAGDACQPLLGRPERILQGIHDLRHTGSRSCPDRGFAAAASCCDVAAAEWHR